LFSSRPRLRRFGSLSACLRQGLLLPLAALLACGVPVAADVGGYLLAAVEALEQGHYQQAEALTRDAERNDPGSAMPRLVQASVQLARFDVASALAGFRQVMAADPSVACGWLGGGACTVQQGDFAGASKLYRAALAANCDSPADVRACLAYALCQAGDLAGARREIEALRERWALTPLAAEVEATIAIAQRDLSGAVEALAEAALAQPDPPQPVMSAVTMPLSLPSPAERVLLALASRPPDGTRATPTAVRPPAAQQLDEQGLHIVSPTAGAAVSGSIQVTVQPEEQLALGYLALLVDGKFRAMSNAAPYRLTLDTHTCTDGPHELRVDGYSTAGVRVAWATRMIVVANGSASGPASLPPAASSDAGSTAEEVAAASGRGPTNGGRHTYAPGQVQVLAEAQGRLEAWLTLRPHPLNRAYLAGRIREAQGQLLDAAAAYEYVFAVQPVYPGVHADLLAVYQRLGLARSNGGPTELRHLPGGSRSVALTFDDGPSPSLTPQLLDQLDQYGAKATFFVIGKQAELYPELVRAIHQRGHELACHSYSHADMTELNALEIERELVKTRALVREATGAVVRYFRPPGGNYDAKVRRAVMEMGYQTVLWSANVADCQGMDAEAAAQRLLRDTDDGGIVLLHNGYDETVLALPKLLAALSQRGFRMRTISQILGSQPPGRGTASEGGEGAAGQ